VAVGRGDLEAVLGGLLTLDVGKICTACGVLDPRGLSSRWSAPVGGDAAERESLGDVAAADLRRAVEVGDGARDPQHAVVAARREVHALGRAQQELAPGAIGRRDPVQETRRPSPSLSIRPRRLVRLEDLVLGVLIVGHNL
jgi:hypothetical protein